LQNQQALAMLPSQFFFLSFFLLSRSKLPNEAMDAALPRIVVMVFVVDRWIRQNGR